MEGEQQNMVSYDKSVRFQGLKYYVCRLVSLQIIILAKKVSFVKSWCLQPLTEK